SGMTGAAILAARAALKFGAGRVYAGLLEPQGFDLAQPELMLRHADDVLGLDLDAVVIGPGLGDSERAETLLGAVLSSDIPCVLDADGLNLISANEDLRKACSRRTRDTIITPHPAEAGRLLAETTAQVQADRLKAARNLSTNLNAHTVLKGNGSVLVAPDGHWFVNTSGNPGMASAGMGDVLAGMLGALLAQKFTGETALVLGTHLHGCAADECVRVGTGPVGLTAGELIEPARRIWNSWLLG
ncbi:MAG: NAD(P)H-hydrate dehydratase, partial [Burkholderiales bacterium]